MQVTNQQFIDAIFGVDAPWCHVTDFPYDPNNIPKDKHLSAWMGDYYSRYRMASGTNQYFTISTFSPDEKGTARRRKALYRQTYCVVLDDVREKLSESAARKLPTPSWILETSVGSEQWGFILDTPCTSRHMIDNLIDGFIESDLCPQNKDSGMAAVTRYVRLPEGSNNKGSKLVDGQPFKCVMKSWSPFNTTTMEQLAEPFGININKERREQRIDGAAVVSDHPILNIPDIIQIKEERSDGRYDITCPWVDEHTGADDSGSAIFTNGDGSMGFACHHGNCAEKNIGDVLGYVDAQKAGFVHGLKIWKMGRELDALLPAQAPAAPVVPLSFMEPPAAPVVPLSFLEPFASSPVITPMAGPPTSLQDAYHLVITSVPNSEAALEYTSGFLKIVDSLPKIQQKDWHKTICSHKNWTQADFKGIMKELRNEWYKDKGASLTYYNDLIYVGEITLFYNWRKKIFYTTAGYQNNYSEIEPDALKQALEHGKVKKVDKLDYAPKESKTYIQDNCLVGNLWSEHLQPDGVAGPVEKWLNHFDVMEMSEHKKHVLQWMAYTLRHPDVKINHALLFGGEEGIGKDYLLFPLVAAMEGNVEVIDGTQLPDTFNTYLLGTKYLHINEIEMGDHAKSLDVATRLKRLCSDPPTTLSINEKNIKNYQVRNIVNITMTTNSPSPIKLQGVSRRLYPMWSPISMRGDNYEMLPEWKLYWADKWGWMKDQNGVLACIDYLMTLDLSDFRPKEAPPVTDFLRDMVDDGKSDAHRALERCLESRLGVFQYDVLTAEDMAEGIRTAIVSGSVSGDMRFVTAVSIGKVLRAMNRFTHIRTKNERLWAIRSPSIYRSMPTRDLSAKYHADIKDFKTQSLFQVVK